jgi:hypothetical protein
MEIYNEALYDLLSDNPAASEGLAIMEDNNGNTQVLGYMSDSTFTIQPNPKPLEFISTCFKICGVLLLATLGHTAALCGSFQPSLTQPSDH